MDLKTAKLSRLARVPNWDVELAKYTDFGRKLLFAWGAADCLLYAAGAVEVQTGRDLAAPHRGKYTDEASARAYMASQGWADVPNVADDFLERVAVADQRRGFILNFEGELGNSLGISLGRFASVMTNAGATHTLSSRATIAWRVG